MKKTLMALAALAMFGQAHAQSSVTIFGNVDAMIARGSGSTASKTQLSSGGMAASILGFRGVEDLGGGMHAGFWLESQFAADSGQGSTTNINNQAVAGAAPAAGSQGLTFNRRSVVTLGGPAGQLILGREYTTVFWTNVAFDPFTNNGVGTGQQFISQFSGASAPYAAYTGTPNTFPVRVSNSISYAYGHTPNASPMLGTGGFYAHAMYFLGENASGAATSKDGSGTGLRLGYTGGPVNVATGYLRTKFAAGDISTWNLAGSYDFGVARVRAIYTKDSVTARSGHGMLLGVTAPAGPGTIRASYTAYRSDAVGNPASKKMAVGYVYDLSKRSALYTTYARVRNSGGASQALNGSVTAANQSSSGLDIGLRHSF